MKKHSYFLDSNVIVSGIAWEGNERRLLELGLSGDIELVTCTYVLSEIERALSKFGYSMAMIIDELLHLRAFMRIMDATEDEVRKHWGILRDKSDVPILASAIKSKCIFVTGDKRFRQKASEHVKVMTALEVVEESG
jgi:putative PIN family toxin of toxin-antitoxin system